VNDLVELYSFETSKYASPFPSFFPISPSNRKILMQACVCAQFGVTSDEVREKFSAIGDIKTFFDLVEKRAMAFVTFVCLRFFLYHLHAEVCTDWKDRWIQYDARAAMMAKDRLHDSLIQGRPVSYHFPSSARLASVSIDEGHDRIDGRPLLVAERC